MSSFLTQRPLLPSPAIQFQFLFDCCISARKQLLVNNGNEK